MASRAKGAKRPWSRERWFFVLLTPIYVALVAYCLMNGGYSMEASTRIAEAPGRGSVIELTLPTSDPACVVLAPTQAPVDARRKLDINQAEAWMLTAIPGIGEAMADRIVAYRDAQGELVAIEELSRIEGVGERLLATLAQYVEVR